MPRKRSEDDPTVPLKVRIRTSLLGWLQAAADERGVSVNQEIVERLGSSIGPKGWRPSPDPKARAIVDLVGDVIYRAGLLAGTFATGDPIEGASWYDNPVAFDQVRKAVDVVLNSIAPSSQGAKESDAMENLAIPIQARAHFSGALDRVGAVSAQMIISELLEEAPEALNKPDKARRDRADLIRSGLGHILGRLRNSAAQGQ